MSSVIRDLRASGIFLERVGSRIRYLINRRADRAILEGEVERIRCLREHFEERAAIREYDAGFTREEAERLAWEAVSGDAEAPS